MQHTILPTLLLLGAAWAMALAVLYRPRWQLRPSLSQALFTAILAAEAAICVGLWELEAAPGLSTSTPLLLLAAGGAMAAGSLRRGRTPAEVRSIRHWRGGIAIFAVGSLVANWIRLDALWPLGRTNLEQDLIANATGIAGFAAFALVVVALAPILAVHRQRWLRRAAVPLAAAMILALPLTIAPAAVSLDSACEASLTRSEVDWCRPGTDDHVVERYTLRSGGWHPEGGVLTSQAARIAGRVPIGKEAWAQGFAAGDGTGVRVGEQLSIDGYLQPVSLTRRLAESTPALGSCFVEADQRGTVEPGRFEVTMELRRNSLERIYVDGGDLELDHCVAEATGRIAYAVRGPTSASFELLYLGQDTELAQR